MTIAFLNGNFLPLDQAKISPMDRGFLFGDGVYEVIPSYGGKLVALQCHLDRLHNSLESISLVSYSDDSELTNMLMSLCRQNGAGNLGIYLQITRGITAKRQHAFTKENDPTCFAYAFPIRPPSDGSIESASCISAVTRSDRRWRRCQIKSTSLLGNVLHMMEAVDNNAEEVLLFNHREELTEAAASNVFVVTQNKRVVTPELDNQKLSGVTRYQALEFMKKYTDWKIEVRNISRSEVLRADEVWLSSSTKELSPVIKIDNAPVGAGAPGPIWSQAQQLFQRYRFSIK